VAEADVGPVEYLRAGLRWFYGTDAEMNHPKSQGEAEKMIEPQTEQTPTTKTEEKLQQASAAIDEAHRSMSRLDEMQPARSVDEALRQILGEQ